MRPNRFLRIAATLCLSALLAVAPISAQDAPDAEAPADPIEIAREAVAAGPEDARAHMRLARELAAAIQADPMNKGPLYSFEMLRALEKTVELDPTLIEAYRYLVGFYLNAPPIAGGSVEKAEETARKLAEHDAEASKALLALVEQNREAAAAAAHQ
jgi:hypothetical protein